MPTTYTEGLHTAEFLLSEAEGMYSREQVTLAAAAAALTAGTLLGKITATGKYVAYADGATDGSQVAVAILYAAAPDLAADQKVTVIARAAEVYSAALVGLDAPARADLATAGIVIRD
ncbi:head decoration protein [Cupriavidus sp. BIC8F]|uniref:head decoration protein n=1 Tax=Cupriavidus sp. BIC8F TaxID=3079014 RepID=UPI002916B8B1|nr:head decoration protein [Cupriavidus sp. BIC8F]